MRKYKQLEGAELKRLASLDGPSGRHARGELERRRLLAAFQRESSEVADRKAAEARRFQERVDALVEAEEHGGATSKPQRKR